MTPATAAAAAGAATSESTGGDVTVVTVTRNRRDGVVDAIERHRKGGVLPPYILVDNASTDGTADAVRARHPEVVIVELPENRGSVARNDGVLAARTPYVAFSDDDSWWAPGALEESAAVFAAYPRLGLLAARTLVGPDERLDPVSAQLVASPLGTDPDLPGPSVLGFLACSAIVRRRAYLAVGGFEPLLFFLAEEMVLAVHLAAAGWGLSYVDEVVAHHHPPPGRPPSRARRRLHGRNELLGAWLCRPYPVAAARTARAVGAGLRDRDADQLASVLALLPLLPAALARREQPPRHIEDQLRLLERIG
ncbi:glycosyltransferase [soil metagenome]